MYQWFAKMYNAQQFILVSALLSVKSVGVATRNQNPLQQSTEIFQSGAKRLTNANYMFLSVKTNNIKYGLCASTSSTVKSC